MLETPSASTAGTLGTRARITGCRSRTGSGHVQRDNCRIQNTSATYDAGFRALFIVTNGSSGTITSVCSPYVRVNAGTLSGSPSPGIVRSTSSGGHPARANLTRHYNVIPRSHGRNRYLPRVVVNCRTEMGCGSPVHIRISRVWAVGRVARMANRRDLWVPSGRSPPKPARSGHSAPASTAIPRRPRLLSWERTPRQSVAAIHAPARETRRWAPSPVEDGAHRRVSRAGWPFGSDQAPTRRRAKPAT